MTDTTCGTTLFKTKNDWTDNTRYGVLYPSDVKTTVINIDSRFRENWQASSSTDFLIKLPRTYKNAITLRLSSVELPNTWYTFSAARGNTSFYLNGVLKTIPDGNYTTTLALTNALNIAGTGVFTSTYNITAPSKITLTGASPFTIKFGSATTCGNTSATNPPSSSSLLPYDSGLGYQLGFTGNVYSGSNTYTAEYVLDTMRDNYVFLQLPELEMMMDAHSYGNSSIKAFAKIVVDKGKNTLVYDNGANTVSKLINFAQPTNISTLRVKLVDAYGLPINLMADFSFTLEVQEVVNAKLYETYRNNLTC
jgi:hypothetical protein